MYFLLYYISATIKCIPITIVIVIELFWVPYGMWQKSDLNDLQIFKGS